MNKQASTTDPLSHKDATLYELQPRNPGSNEAALELLTHGWTGLLDGHFLDLLETAMSDWLPRQRWFGAKARKIQFIRVLDRAELSGAIVANRANGPISSSGGHPADSTMPPALFFIEIAYADGPSDIYQLPLAISTGAEAEALIAGNPQSILATFKTPAGPAVLHDATTREDFRQSLLSLIERNATLALSNPQTAAVEIPASLEAHASTAFSKAHDSDHLASRVGSVEQSNTSIIYGKLLILKLFRRLQVGENPDVEIGRFMTEVAHFPHIAPFLGEITMTPAGGQGTTVAMLQGLVANQGDGWRWFLEQLVVFFGSVAALPAPPKSLAPSFLEQSDPRDALGHFAPMKPFEHVAASLEAAALLGRRTAEMHLALATPTSDPAFAAEPFTPADIDLDARRISAQIASTLDALNVKLSSLNGTTADDASLLLSRRADLFDRANAILGTTAAGQRIRIHGDYHLGQTLRTGGSSIVPGTAPGDFVVLDFEGEPARLLAERRQKQSPLKDIAGMIRSLSYASQTGLHQYLTANPELVRTSGSDHLAAWAIFWKNATSAEFLRAYRETIDANPALLPSPQQSQSLLDAYLLEKALYELLYELNNRPAWLHIPLSGILSL